jgi:hypothetical protein
MNPTPLILQGEILHRNNYFNESYTVNPTLKLNEEKYFQHLSFTSIISYMAKSYTEITTNCFYELLLLFVVS